MLLKVYSVYDSKVQAYLPPIFLRSKGEAIRSFAMSVNSTDHQFHVHCEDFTMFELGDWEDSTCEFTLYPTPVSIGKAIEFLKPEVSRELPRGLIDQSKVVNH